jgi:hypothetical protein
VDEDVIGLANDLMCFQVYFKPSHRYIERELESSAKTRLPLHSPSLV